jgi:hypothetical protein
VRHRQKFDCSRRGATRRIYRRPIQVHLGRRARTITLFQSAVIPRRNPLLLASSVDCGDQKESDARLRVVRLEKDPPERPIFEGSRRQARNHRGPVSGLLKRG